MMTLAPPRPAARTAGGPANGAQSPADRKSGFYRHDLDGLRGIAIALVAVFHVWFGRVSGGVDVFLALSGFFFGGRLLRTALTPGRVAVAGSRGDPAGPPAAARARRGARRVGRADNSGAAGNALGNICRPEPGEPRLLTRTGNWPTPRRTIFAPAKAVSPLQHIWSMSVQGQFYIGFLALIFVFALAVPPASRQVHAGVTRACS